MRSRTALLGVSLLIGSSLTIPAQAAPLTVLGTDDIYNATNPGSLDGTNPNFISVAGFRSFTFSTSTGPTVVLNVGSGSTYNDADGVGASPSTSSNSGANGIAGLTAPNAGYLTGVFVGATLAPTPAALNFVTTGTNFASLSPALQQTFFIGDGLTGDATGTSQTFFVPAGATSLYLGISDACGYNGSPSCYSDNAGSFNVTAVGMPATTTAVPEPVSWAMMITGFGLIGAGMRYRRRRTVLRYV